MNDQVQEHLLASIKPFVPEGAVAVGFVLAVNFVDTDGSPSHSTWHVNCSIPERIGLGRILEREAEAAWEV